MLTKKDLLDAIAGKVFEYSKKRKVMIEDLTISYVEGGIETTMTVKDDYYGNIHYMLAEMFEKVIRASDANPQIVIEKMKNSFQYD